MSEYSFTFEDRGLTLEDGTEITPDRLQAARRWAVAVGGSSGPPYRDFLVLYGLDGRRFVRVRYERCLPEQGTPLFAQGGRWRGRVAVAGFIDQVAAVELLRMHDPAAADSLGKLADQADAPPATDAYESPPARGASGERGSRKGKLPPSRVAAKAAYEWALSKIPGADEMTVAQIWDAIEAHPDMNASFLAKLPDNPATFVRYLHEAGVRRYDADGKRTRRVSHFPRADQR